MCTIISADTQTPPNYVFHVDMTYNLNQITYIQYMCECMSVHLCLLCVCVIETHN